MKAGDGQEAAADTSIDDWQRDVMPTLIAGVEPCNIYNADETALFYRILPHHTYTLRDERCQGGKKKKDRVSVLLATNMDGSDKLMPLIIGHYAKPRCQNVQSLPVVYHNSKNAWMTSDIFGEWLRIFNSRRARERAGMSSCSWTIALVTARPR